MENKTDDIIGFFKNIQEKAAADTPDEAINNYLSTAVKIKEIKRELSMLEELKDQYEAELMTWLDNVGIMSIKTKTTPAVTLSKTRDFRASCPTDEREGAAFEWLDENNLGHLIRRRVDARSLSSALRDLDKDVIADAKDVLSIYDGWKISNKGITAYAAFQNNRIKE